jgi:putative endonuclease
MAGQSGQLHPAESGTPSGMKYFVYILRSKKDGSFYVGQTNNLADRLLRHNSGYNRFTRPRTPYELVYKEEFNSRSDAVRREMKIKSYKGGQLFKNLIE